MFSLYLYHDGARKGRIVQRVSAKAMRVAQRLLTELTRVRKTNISELIEFSCGWRRFLSNWTQPRRERGVRKGGSLTRGGSASTGGRLGHCDEQGGSLCFPNKGPVLPAIGIMGTTHWKQSSQDQREREGREPGGSCRNRRVKWESYKQSLSRAALPPRRPSSTAAAALYKQLVGSAQLLEQSL